MNGAGVGSGGASGRPVDRAVTAQARAAEQASAEVRRLNENTQLALSAMSAIWETARRLSRYSARVRVLELEVLPAAHYLAACMQSLYSALPWWKAPLCSPAQLIDQVNEIGVMLERAIDITAGVDIPGELGLPLELVSTVQSGARAGLASVERLRTILDEYASAVEHGELHIEVDELQPNASARWLVHTASRLLPPGSRDRYAEEFAAELRALADARAGWRDQLAHAVRQVATIWALRRALPSATPRPTSPDRVQAPLGSGRHARRQERPTDRLRGSLDLWLATRHARKVIEEQAKSSDAQPERKETWPEALISTPPFPGGQRRHLRRRAGKRR